jgi:hypothetical protein
MRTSFIQAAKAELDAQTCRLICPLSATMVGVCLTGISVLHVVQSISRRDTWADDLLTADALLFLLSTLASYFALRAQSQIRLHWLERLADGAFIVAMLLLTAACFVVTYTIT